MYFTSKTFVKISSILSASEILFPWGFAFLSTSVFLLFSSVILPLKRHELYAKFVFIILLKPCKYQNPFPFRESSKTLLYNNSFHIAGEKGLNTKLYAVIVLLINLQVSTLKPSAKNHFQQLLFIITASKTQPCNKCHAL